MTTKVTIGNDEVVLSGMYLIPVSESNISILIPETNYMFKISFEEFIEDNSEKKEFKRMEVIDTNESMASVLFSYRSNEKHFGSTKKPNNIFYTLEDSEDSEDTKIKTQYQFSIFVDISPKNSLRMSIQITKKEKQKVNING